MTGLVEPIRRVEGKAFGRPTHWYEDATGARVPGVTSLLDAGLPKKALVGWGIRSVAEYAVDHWPDLSAMAEGILWCVAAQLAREGRLSGPEGAAPDGVVERPPASGA